MSNKGLIRQFGAQLWREVKAASAPLQFPGFGGGQGSGFASLFSLTQALNGAYANSQQNWAGLVGDPSLSSLTMAAAGWVGRRLSEARLQVVETDNEDNDEPLLGHALPRLLARPNPHLDAACLWEHFAFGWILDGNVYWWLRRNARGQVAEIWPLPHWLVWPRWRREDEYIAAYEYAPNGRSIFYAPSDIIHFRGGLSDPDNTRKGMSPLRSILREIFTDSELASYSAALIKNSGVPPLLVTTKEMAAGLRPEDVSAFQSELKRRVSGDARGNPLFHSWPLHVERLSFNPEELDLRKLRFMSEERFCSVVGINAIVLGFGSGAEHSIYNNVESARRSAIEEYLCPLWTRIAGTLEHQLLRQPQFDAQENQHVRFDTTAVEALQEKENEKHDRVRKDVMAGLLKVRDAQSILGWPADDDTDYYLRPSGLVEVRDGQAAIAAPPLVEPVENKPDGAQENDEQMDAQKAVKALHDFSSTQVDIVGATSAAMLRFREAIADEDLAQDGREGNAHITVLYGIHTDSADEVRMALGRVYGVSVQYGRTDYFSTDAYDVVYVSVESPDLVALNKLLRSSLPHTPTHPTYTPHATLAYVKPGLGPKYAGADFLRGRTDSFGVLVFASKGGLRTQIPLAIIPHMNGKTIKRESDEPTPAEIDAAIDFWRDVAPEADGLITAEVVESA